MGERRRTGRRARDKKAVRSSYANLVSAGVGNVPHPLDRLVVGCVWENVVNRHVETARKQ